jgi:hypothetical protein
MFEDSETEEPEMRAAAALKTPDVDHVRKVTTSCRSKRKSQLLISPMASSAAKRRKISIAGINYERYCYRTPVTLRRKICFEKLFLFGGDTAYRLLMYLGSP